ncbi:MaoC family dehydratase N-terminal domain-containing protein [Nakamurella endophytica]|uniref:UPF0336 protein GCM10011594_24820 n=1 Tax=Nakamurella endophytica TaxID=1748367 RepID=A0A917WFX3_9ACTN|nr:MaoC family dehydratase N-terminal domain-containing protein [Nakamurella endophytica]GGM03667.1 UPF0336 protein [Nakamurella endophytica]
MPLEASFVGRPFPLGEPYEVGVEKVREFCAAIGETNPLCVDRAAARAAGYPDLIAPPTFAIAVVAGAQDRLLFHPELGLDFSRVVHRDQRFTHHRPIHAGDVLSAVACVDSLRVLAGNDVVSVRTEITDAAGDPVCTTVGTLVARAAE